MNTEIKKLKTIFLTFVVGVFMTFGGLAHATPEDGLGPDDQPPSWPSIFEALLVDWDSAKTVAQNLVESSGVVKAARTLVDEDNSTVIVRVLGGKVGIGGNPEDGFLLYVHGDLWAENLEGDSAVFNSLEIKTDSVVLQEGSISGSALENDSVTSDHLTADSVTGDQIQDGSVESADLAENSVSTNNIIDGTIKGYNEAESKAGDIAKDAITSYELASDAVSSEHIENHSITINDLDENIIFDWDMFPTASLALNMFPLWDGENLVSSSLSETDNFIATSKVFKFSAYTDDASMPACSAELIGSVAFNSGEEKLLLCTSAGWQEIGQGAGGSAFAIENQGAWCGYHGINNGTLTSVKEAVYECAGYDPQNSCPEGYTQAYFRTLQDDADTIADEVYTCVYSDLNKTFLGTGAQGAWCGYQGVNAGFGNSVYANKIRCGLNNPKDSCPAGYAQVVFNFTAVDGDLLEDTIYSCVKTSTVAEDYNNGWYGWSGQNEEYNSVYDGIIENNNLDPEAACAEGYLKAYFSTTAYKVDENPDFGYFCVKKPVEQTCGNSIIEGTEVCDDGNTTSGDGCASDCLSMDLGYTCPQPGVACQPVAICGNGQFESGEACDDGNTVSGDGCTADCRFIETVGGDCVDCPNCCGDGVLSAEEVCDDGNTDGGDGCVADCSEIMPGWSCPVPGEPCYFNCGNGDIDAGEYCDDFDLQSGDGCNANCQVEPGWDCPADGGECTPLCGNGVEDVMDGYVEECDDGNQRSGDGCSFRACQKEPGYECTEEGEPCTPLCGNSTIDITDDYVETCDDGPDNKVSNDGCSYPYCQLEVPGWECNTVGSACTPIVSCGDGVLHNGIIVPEEDREECDDGNDIDGDGCSSECKKEAGFECIAAGFPCVDTSTELLNSCEELQKIGDSNYPEYPIDKDYALIADIDCSMTNPANQPDGYDGPWSDGNGFVPLPEYDNIFDGQGYEISNLYINNNAYRIGLFSGLASNSEIKNLQLINVDITGEDSYVGAIAGYGTSTINNVYVTGVVTGDDYVGGLMGSLIGSVADAYFSGTVNGNYRTGGLVGNLSGSIINSSAIVSLPADISGYGDYKGGIAGYLGGSAQNVSAYVDLLEGDDYLGGIVGHNGQVYDADATVNILGNSSLGGISGGSNVYDSKAVASILGNQYIGGIIGGLNNYYYTLNNNTATVSIIGGNNLGGISGKNGGIRSSYARGSILGAGNIGGLMGNIYTSSYASFVNSYADVDIKGFSYLGGLIGASDSNTTYPINCYSLGKIEGKTDNVGALSGHHTSFNNNQTSFWSSELSGQEYPFVGTGTVGAQDLSADELKDINKYIDAGWNFDTGGDWKQISVNHYPCLVWQDDSTCLPVASQCGNGVIEGLETCDDFNNNSGDGCSADCLAIEANYSCPYAGFACVSDDGIEIDSCEELQLIGRNKNYPLYGNYKLSKNIDCSATNPSNGGSGFNSIGSSTPFLGKFDGNNYSISNVYYSRGSTDGSYTSSGIFYNTLFAEIKNVKVENFSAGGTYVAGVVHNAVDTVIDNCFVSTTQTGNYFGGIAYSANYSTIKNSSASISGGNSGYIGGIVYWPYNSNITNCSTNLELTGNNIRYIGGIVGGKSSDNQGNTIIDNCSATLSFDGTNSSLYVGGIIGYLNDQTQVLNSSANVDIVTNGEGSHLGGIVGYATYGGGKIINSSASGYIEGHQNLGGIVGYINNGAQIDGSYADIIVNGTKILGGIAGYVYRSGSIINSYSTGAVYGDEYISGLAGYVYVNNNSAPTFENNYSLASVDYERFGGTLVGAVTKTNISYPDVNLDSNFAYQRSTEVEIPICGSTGYIGGISLLVDQLKEQTIFEDAGWDYTTPVWKQENIDPPREFAPCLAWQDAEDCYSVDDLSCGNGQLQGEETCDDMNNISGDGCTDKCAVEDGWNCYQDPFIDETSMNGVTRCTKATLIQDCAGLQAIESDLDADYEIIKDIDCSETATWNPDGSGGYYGFNPIGLINAPFTGTLDGRGHEITGLTIERNENRVGLFNNTENATIKMLGLKDVYIKGISQVGGLVGGAGNSTLISECFVTGLVQAINTGQSSTQIGGIVGSGAGINIGDSYVIVNTSGYDSVGSIAGNLNSSHIIRVYSDSTVGGELLDSYVGSIAGFANDIDYAYWNIDKNNYEPCGNICSATGLTTEQMFELNSFPQFASNIWKLPTTGTSPCLAWQEDENCPGYVLDPIGISSCEDLQKIGKEEEYPMNGRYILTQNIDCSETVTWNPDGTGGYFGFEPLGEFIGVFEGNNKTITGLYINRPTENTIGLFSTLKGAEVRNLGLVGLNITGGSQTGGLAGATLNQTEIVNVYTKGTVSGAPSQNRIGGLIGQQNYTIVDNCYSEATVTGYDYYVGGLVGELKSSSEIKNSHTTGDVNSSSTSVGGLAGVSNASIVDNCYSTSSVKGGNSTGGLIGNANSAGGKTINSHATGEVEGNNSVGGLIGLNQTAKVDNCYSEATVTANSKVGGLIGSNQYAEVSNSHNTGSVTASSGYAGGLVGENTSSSAKITNSYNTGSVTATGNYAGGLTGYNFNNAIVEYSYNTGLVTGAMYVGGLAGYNYFPNTKIASSYNTGTVSGNSYMGGVVGQNTSNAIVSNSYNTGVVVDLDGNSDTVAGLVGRNAGIVENSYYNTETSNQTSTCGTILPCAEAGLTSAEMSTSSNFSTWIFSPTPDADWQLPTGGTSPCLIWQDTATCPQ